jgi:hypothetical protein
METPDTERRARTEQTGATHRGIALSWAALVAATTAGLGVTEPVRTAIRVESDLGLGPHRLVVQSYEADSVRGEGRPIAGARPRGSAQREVSAAELRRGVAVTLLEVQPVGPGQSVIVAWVEPGSADLEFDGRGARPAADAVLGVAPSLTESGRAEVVLRRSAA